MKTPRKKPRHNESKLQISCVSWFRLQYPNLVLYAIPNGGKRNAFEAEMLKREGVLAGVADLFLVKRNSTYCGLFIEMKFGNGKQTDAQKAFELKVINEGYMYAVVRTFDEFTNIMNKYINS